MISREVRQRATDVAFDDRLAAASIVGAVVPLVIIPVPRLVPRLRQLDGVTGLHGEDLGIRRPGHVIASAANGRRIIRRRIRGGVVRSLVPVLVWGVELFERGRLVTDARLMSEHCSSTEQFEVGFEI